MLEPTGHARLSSDGRLLRERTVSGFSSRSPGSAGASGLRSDLARTEWPMNGEARVTRLTLDSLVWRITARAAMLVIPSIPESSTVAEGCDCAFAGRSFVLHGWALSEGDQMMHSD